jgi:hypothetical protein
MSAVSLQNEIKRAIEILNKTHPIPHFTQILICDGGEIYDGANLCLNSGVLYEVSDFQTRFENILSFGYPWVNIQILGIYKEKLVISIETPIYFPRTLAKKPSFNISGPENRILNDFRWRLDSFYKEETGQFSSKKVKEILISEKRNVDPKILLKIWNPFEIEPKALYILWDYEPKKRIKTWLVYFNQREMIGIVFSQSGFGPKCPWGLVGLDENPPHAGMDCSWCYNLPSTIENSF